MRKKIFKKLIYIIQSIMLMGILTGIIPALICGEFYKILGLGG